MGTCNFVICILHIVVLGKHNGDLICDVIMSTDRWAQIDEEQWRRDNEAYRVVFTCLHCSKTQRRINYLKRRWLASRKTTTRPKTLTIGSDVDEDTRTRGGREKGRMLDESRDDDGYDRYSESGIHSSGRKMELTTLSAVGHGGESIT